MRASLGALLLLGNGSPNETPVYDSLLSADRPRGGLVHKVGVTSTPTTRPHALQPNTGALTTGRFIKTVGSELPRWGPCRRETRWCGPCTATAADRGSGAQTDLTGARRNRDRTVMGPTYRPILGSARARAQGLLAPATSAGILFVVPHDGLPRGLGGGNKTAGARIPQGVSGPAPGRLRDCFAPSGDHQQSKPRDYANPGY